MQEEEEEEEYVVGRVRGGGRGGHAGGGGGRDGGEGGRQRDSRQDVASPHAKQARTNAAEGLLHSSPLAARDTTCTCSV